MNRGVRMLAHGCGGKDGREMRGKEWGVGV